MANRKNEQQQNRDRDITTGDMGSERGGDMNRTQSSDMNDMGSERGQGRADNR